MSSGGGIRKRLIRTLLYVVAGFIFVLLIVALPRFDKPLSTVARSSDGRLLGAHIAADEQWRFPSSVSLPDNYIRALINYEDRWYYYHPGVNVPALFRSLLLNIREGKIVSGGSTIAMQVARLSGDNPPRTIPRKLLEIFMALKLELRYSKTKVLELYAANAPFGGNIVGIEAASWRYFNREASELSWGEAALLAVLPNSPSLIYPGRNDDLLLDKRNSLLSLLQARGEIDSLTAALAMDEPLPAALFSLPRYAPAVTNIVRQDENRKSLNTTIDLDIQKQVIELTRRNMLDNADNEIHNIAALVVEIETGRIVSYVGNLSDQRSLHSGDVDMVRANRSTGSILKPFLYAAMLESGDLTPHMLVRDVPVEFSGYSPKNYDLEYRGVVKASEALSRSLNVPAVEMLRVYTPDRFLHLLNGLGFTSFSYDADHYGLSLILGGGEANLLELTGVYARMAFLLKHYEQGKQVMPRYNKPYLVEDARSGTIIDPLPLSAGSIWCTFEAMKEVNRPEAYSGWKNFSSSENIAWKTGTSFGYRDAWAIAVSPDYAIGVWAGNADGEGRTGLTGVGSAAPLLFDIVDLLNPDSWFTEPMGDMTYIDICAESGHRASAACPDIVVEPVPIKSLTAVACPYHKVIHLTEDETYRVRLDCYSGGPVIEKSWFILPPGPEWYYKKSNYDYRDLPPMHPDCAGYSDLPQIELLYPRNLNGIYIPLENDGQRGRVVFEAAHRKSRSRLFWHLDNTFIAETSIVHQLALQPSPGEHTLTIVDEAGNTLELEFSVI